MILEMLKFKDAFNLCYVLKLRFGDAVRVCDALKISIEFSYQYHQFKPNYSFYLGKIYDYKTRKVVNPNLAKALLKNSSFQSLAEANEKVKYSILSEDLDLVINALEDPRVNHNQWSSPLRMACEYGSLDAVKLLVNEYGINISAHDN